MGVFVAAEAINMALQIEENGEAFYKGLAARFQDPPVKAVLEDLAVQEQRHYEAFLKLSRYVTEPVYSLEEWEEYARYLEVAVDNAIFAGPDKALALADSIADVSTALRMALGFEKDTLLFYYDLRELMREADRAVVDEIIREEKAHVRRLAALLGGARSQA
ncbi:MAG: ferritin family protein [Anaerolineae bacterium]|nr:ferritin family protein [Anaerolineae bacterium]MDW7991542.1 ferritin family protein [Anaerolineae bacterium]MDW8068657.1 ferritin family protein [Anaerolineae bacterium]